MKKVKEIKMDYSKMIGKQGRFARNGTQLPKRYTLDDFGPRRMRSTPHYIRNVSKPIKRQPSRVVKKQSLRPAPLPFPKDKKFDWDKEKEKSVETTIQFPESDFEKTFKPTQNNVETIMNPFDVKTIKKRKRR